MRLTWYQLAFPDGLGAENVAEILGVLGAQSRGGLLSRPVPVVIETEMRRRSVAWRIGSNMRALQRLRMTAEAVCPGVSWEEIDQPPVSATRAVELRVVGLDRLMDIDAVEQAARRLLGVGQELKRDESVVVQWQIGPWLPRSPIAPGSNQVDRSLWGIWHWGEPERDSEQITAARKKQAHHLFACVGRLAVTAATADRSHRILASTAGAMQLLRAPGVGVSRRAIPSWWVRTRMASYRVPAIGPACRLSAAELAGLIGWPIGNPRLPGVTYVKARVVPLDERILRPATDDVLATERVVGEAVHSGQSGRVAVLPPRAALRHAHLIGPTGSGKSTLLVRLILSDLGAGRAVVAIDPKGDLVTDVLARLPRDLPRDLVVLDPTDASPVGFNPLSGGAAGIDGVLHVLRSVWSDSWGPRLGDVLLAGLLTLSANPGHSLAELPLLLTDEVMRRPLVRKAVASDPIGLGSFWPWFDGLTPDLRAQVLAPVMSRMRALLLRPELRGVLAQPEPRFDLRQIFTNRASLLVRLPKGQMGVEGVRLLGSALVAHLWRLAQARSTIPADRRHPVSLVLDEFQEFLRLPVDVADALVQARGLGVGLTLAHQHLGQLDTTVRNAVLANAGSRLVFRSDVDDASTLVRRMGTTLSAEDLMGLDPFHAYASLQTNHGPTEYGSLRTLALPKPSREPSEVLTDNRQRWGVDRAETEARLQALIAGVPDPVSSSDGRPIGGRRTSGGRS